MWIKKKKLIFWSEEVVVCNQCLKEDDKVNKSFAPIAWDGGDLYRKGSYENRYSMHFCGKECFGKYEKEASVKKKEEQTIHVDLR
jgi:hypothetical protein